MNIYEYDVPEVSESSGITEIPVPSRPPVGGALEQLLEHRIEAPTKADADYLEPVAFAFGGVSVLPAEQERGESKNTKRGDPRR
jgi:hypothetical protein